MLNSIWQDLLTTTDQQVIDAAGYRERGASTFTSRGTHTTPALLIIDMQRLFVGEDVAILDAIQTEPTMIGERGWRAMGKMNPLIDAFRAQQRPIIYARMLPNNRPVNDPLLQISKPIAPHADDIIIDKNTSSPFFKTELAETLRASACDSVVIVGNSTSGCVRAAAVDAVQHGFTAIIPHDCVFDRIETSHKISLLDLWMKYAIVTSSAQLLTTLSNQQEDAS